MFEPSKGGSSPLANAFLQNKATAPTAGQASQMPTITQPVQAPMDFGSMAPRQPKSAAPKRFSPSPAAQFLLAMGANPKTLLGDNYNAWASAPVTQGQLSQQSGGYGGQASRYKAGGHR